MLYITLLDQFHAGIYSSQVIDVCDYLNKKHNTKIRIVAFLSIREIRISKPKIKALSPNALVFPAFPGLKFYQLTAILLFFICLFTGERIAICRNVFCTNMALLVKKFGLLKKVVFDGRSAMNAEIGEYDVFPVNYLRNNVAKWEAQAVNETDFQMAVSTKLIEYWKIHYNYKTNSHVVIPCTLDEKHFNSRKFELNKNCNTLKTELGFKETDIVIVYAGSNAPWQSFNLLQHIICPLLDTNEHVKILFLSKENTENLELQKRYPTKITIKFVEHKLVLQYLQCCDYGLLVRDQSDTNKVASPVKFAEYLYAGLNVIISNNLGDFSNFVLENNCGEIYIENKMLLIQKINMLQKTNNFDLAKKYFMKSSVENEISYKKIINSI